MHCRKWLLGALVSQIDNKVGSIGNGWNCSYEKMEEFISYFRYSSFFLSSCSLYNAIIICCRLFVWHFGPMLPKFLRLIDLNKTSSKDFSRHEFFITFSNSTTTVHNIFRNNSWWLTSVALILERTLWRKLVWILTTSWFWM